MAPYRLTKLHSELEAAGLPVIGVAAVGLLDSNGLAVEVRLDWSRALTAPEQTQADSIKAAHDPTDYDAQQATSAHASLRALLNSLSVLPAEDAAYALMGRAMAQKDGASQATIDGIVSRASAAAYLTGKTEWVNLPAAAKAWMADQLDMEAVLFQAVILALRR